MQKRNFALYPRQQPADIGATITLRELLRDHREGRPSFDYVQKLKVALAMARCVLHLYKTPWLARVLTLDDFVFLRADVSLMSGPQSPDLKRSYGTRAMKRQPPFTSGNYQRLY